MGVELNLAKSYSGQDFSADSETRILELTSPGTNVDGIERRLEWTSTGMNVEIPGSNVELPGMNVDYIS